MSPAGWILITRIILWLFLQRHHLCKCANANELTGKTQTWGALRVAYVVFLPTEQIVTYRIRTVGHFITHESQHQHALQESTIVPILARESAWLNLFRCDMRHQSNWLKKSCSTCHFQAEVRKSLQSDSTETSVLIQPESQARVEPQHQSAKLWLKSLKTNTLGHANRTSAGKLW